MKEVSLGIPYKFTRNQALVEYHDILIQAFADIGYQLVMTKIAAQSTHEMLISGLADVVAYDDLGDHTGRENIITTSFPVVITAGTIFYSKVRPVREKNLRKYRGAISHNNVLLIHEAEKRKLKFIQTSNPFHCIQTVIEKKADYCITVREVGLSTIESNPDAKGRIVALEAPFMKIPVYVSMNKKFEKDLPKLEDALKKILRGDLSKFPALRPVLNTQP